MLPFQPASLTQTEIERLARLTEPFLAEDYQTQINNVSRRWKNASFDSIRSKLMDARPRQNRCVYCESEEGTCIDHLRPKSIYPWLAFCWGNFIPSCVTCGGSTYKGSKDAILDSTPIGYHETNAHSTPPDGSTAWWNPRIADPMSVFELDLACETFLFKIIATVGSSAHARADWTLKTLGLNTRSNLVKQRRMAYRNYCRILRELGGALKNEDGDEIIKCQEDFLDMYHPTVWAEMKRQRDRLPALAALFDAYTPALGW